MQFAYGYSGWPVICHALADMFAADDRHFDRETFLAACRPGSNAKAFTSKPALV
jgi:hypothetical protein